MPLCGADTDVEVPVEETTKSQCHRSNPDVEAALRVGHQEAEKLRRAPVVGLRTGTLESLQAKLHVFPQDSAIVMSENPRHIL